MSQFARNAPRVGKGSPDLAERFATQAPLNEYVNATFHAGGASGYTDYPALSQELPPAQAAAGPG